jgi:hypothetical protein
MTYRWGRGFSARCCTRWRQNKVNSCDASMCKDTRGRKRGGKLSCVLNGSKGGEEGFVEIIHHCRRKRRMKNWLLVAGCCLGQKKRASARMHCVSECAHARMHDANDLHRAALAPHSTLSLYLTTTPAR